jgi:segregation and condensation protein B
MLNGLMDGKLAEVFEALLFSSSDPLSVNTIQSLFARAAEAQREEQQEQGTFGDVTDQTPAILAAGRIREGMSALGATLDERGSVYQLDEGPGGWRLVLRPRYVRWVRLLRDEPSPKRLGASIMETLAVVAYRQPVTRALVEAIRGVACERALAKLVELELVHIAGRADLPGRPMQYATTDRFLEYCGLGSLEEMPTSDLISADLLDRVIAASANKD